jgi:hypothetical protein
VNVWGWVSSRGTGICVTVEERLTALVFGHDGAAGVFEIEQVF